jgi:hypothetical protein
VEKNHVSSDVSRGFPDTKTHRGRPQSPGIQWPQSRTSGESIVAIDLERVETVTERPSDARPSESIVSDWPSDATGTDRTMRVVFIMDMVLIFILDIVRVFRCWNFLFSSHYI